MIHLCTAILLGAGALVVEDLDSALERNATIYAEILGGHVNSGGQRGTGSMTAPLPGTNPEEEARSEERRVGKECRSRWSPYH